MLIFLFWLIGVFLLVLQTALLPQFFSMTFTPDFVFIFIAFCAYRFSWIPGLLLSFSFGWMIDVATAVHLGFYPLEFLMIFSALKLLTTNTPVKAAVYQLPLVGVGYVCWKVCSYILRSLSHPEFFIDWSAQHLLYGSVITLVAAIPCFAFFGQLYELLEKMKKSQSPPRRRPRKLV